MKMTVFYTRYYFEIHLDGLTETLMRLSEIWPEFEPDFPVYKFKPYLHVNLRRT